MDLREFTFRLVILFFPGLLAFMIFERLTVHKKTEPFFFVINSFVFGIVAYFCTWTLSLGLFPAINAKLQTLHAQWKLIPVLDLPIKIGFWEELKNSNQTVELGEIAWTCGIAVFLAIFASLTSNRKLHYRIARWLRISRKSGEMDVWGFVMNSRDPQTIFVTVRDQGADIMYDGWIHSFSEDHTTTELLLRDVAVYRNSTSEFLYQIGAMYFKIDPKKVILEFRGIPITEKHKIENKHVYEQEQSNSASGLHQRGIAEEGRSQSHTNEPTPSSATTTTSCPTTNPSSTSSSDTSSSSKASKEVNQV